MKWTYQWLTKYGRPEFSFHEQVRIDAKQIAKNPRILALGEIDVKGTGRFQATVGQLDVQGQIKGVMVVPDAQTLEPLNYPFETDFTLTYLFAEEPYDDAIIIKGNTIDFDDDLWMLIQMEIPLRVVKNQLK